MATSADDAGIAMQSVTGTPRGPEYSSVLEQDPYGEKHGTGSNDDIWGEWCDIYIDAQLTVFSRLSF